MYSHTASEEEWVSTMCKIVDGDGDLHKKYVKYYMVRNMSKITIQHKRNHLKWMDRTNIIVPKRKLV